MPPDRSDEEPQTAMLLTQQEWEDLAAICSHYRTHPWGATVGDAVAAVLRRRFRLCERIEEAAS